MNNPSPFPIGPSLRANRVLDHSDGVRGLRTCLARLRSEKVLDLSAPQPDDDGARDRAGGEHVSGSHDQSRPVTARMTTTTSPRPSSPPGKYPHSRLCDQVGSAPMSMRRSTTTRMVPNIFV